MFPPYVVKFPHANTGVLPFLYPGYGGLLPSGFTASHLPITGRFSYEESVAVSILRMLERVIILLYLLEFYFYI